MEDHTGAEGVITPPGIILNPVAAQYASALNIALKERRKTVSERISNERFSEYMDAAALIPEEQHGVVERLIYWLKAEREKVEELEAWKKAVITVEKDRIALEEILDMETKIEELEAFRQKVVEEIRQNPTGASIELQALIEK